MTITERIDAITGLSPTYRAEVIPAPRSCKIEITAECNYNCSFCARSVREMSGSMDRALFSRIIRDLFASGVEELGLFYIGESFTCKWLPEAIAEAKSVGFPYVFLTTNGAAAPPERVKACMQAGLDSLKFSMNFYDREQMAKVAAADPRYWQRAIDNLKAARGVRDEGNYSCRLYASSIAFDGEQGRKMQALVDDIEPFVDEHYWLPLYGMGGASKAAGWKPQPGNPGRLDNMREPLPCWAVFTEAHVTVDGLLAACCFGSGLNGDLIMSDLKQHSFMEAWNSPAYQALRRAHLSRDVSATACAECAAG
jgi:MoaA/NifB/PqqE/SkfB family radical SAM enzyme